MIKFGLAKPDAIWRAKKAAYGYRESPNFWEDQRDETLKSLRVQYRNRPHYLAQSTLRPSLWLIVEGIPKEENRQNLELLCLTETFLPMPSRSMVR